MIGIKVDGIYKSYQQGGSLVVALENIQFQISTGEFCAIIGPSGCGKSTLLQIIAGVVKPSQGQVLVDGCQVQKPGADRLIVAQEFGFFPWKSVYANVDFALRMQHVAERERASRIMEMLTLMRLVDFQHHYPFQLSTGMQQRLALARALAARPVYLLLDEPFGALDLPLRQEMQVEVSRICQAESCTVLLVTHDIEEAIYLADRIIVLSARPGKIVRQHTVPFVRPRLPEIRHSSTFTQLKQSIAEQLASNVSSTSLL